jgi:hypothetical protein
MSGKVISCKLCKTPLNNKDQFVGHHVHSHDWSLEEAMLAWQLSTTKNKENFSSKITGDALK